MNNKRYILTVDSEKNVILWEANSGRIIKEFSQEFPQVKKLLTEQYDQIHSKENPLPHSWFTVDINTGSLTIILEEDKWMKGVVTDDHNMEVILSSDSQQSSKRSDQKINLGVQLLQRTMRGFAKDMEKQ